MIIVRTIHPVQQGTGAWLRLREGFDTASDAPSAMGVGKYTTRDALLRKKKTGIAEEHSAATLGKFTAGHAAEAMARPLAEVVAEGELFPVTMSIEIDGLRLLASMDGLTMEGDIAWETKLWNEQLAEHVRAGTLPEHYTVQMDQELLVSGAQRCLFTCTDGTQENFVSCWYESSETRFAALLAGWRQFAEDLATYQPEVLKPEAIGRAPEALPALFVQVEGKVVSSNLPAFRAAAAEFLDRLPKALETDQDFADGEKAVKACKAAEDRLATVKDQAQSQAVTIDEVFRSIDAISEQIRAARLSLDKRVMAEKENRRTEIVMAARLAIEEHIAGLNKRIGGAWMPAASGTLFSEAIKGLKSLDSMRDKVGSALANAKVDASAMADRIEANRKAIDDMTLAPDFAQICIKDTEFFTMLIAARKRDRDEAAAARLEAERARIRADEQAKAERESRAKAKAEQDARDAETARSRALEQERFAAAQKEAVRVALEADRAAQAVRVAAAPANAVIEHQDEISAFLASRDFKQDVGKVRAILVEFVKFQALRNRNDATT